MKKWIQKNKLIILGSILGALAGFLYWKYVGCLNGTCAITSNPIRSIFYFAFLEAILFSLFKRNEQLGK